MWDKFINWITPQFGPDLYTQYGDWATIWVPYVLWYIEKLFGIVLVVVLFISLFRKVVSKKHSAYGTVSLLLLVAVAFYFKWLAGYPEGPDWPIDLYMAYLTLSSAFMYLAIYHISNAINLCICRDE